jgi:hypothetical protein
LSLGSACRVTPLADSSALQRSPAMPNAQTDSFKKVKDLTKWKEILGKKRSLAPKDVVEDWDKMHAGYEVWNAKIKLVSQVTPVDLSITYYKDLVVEKEKYNKITHVWVNWLGHAHDIFKDRAIQKVPTV